MTKSREVRFDMHGKIRLMAAVDGYVMVRRPYSNPFVLRAEDWQKLPLSEEGSEKLEVHWQTIRAVQDDVALGEP